MIPRLAEHLTAEFGKGFDASNLRQMRLFHKAFPIRDALRHDLSVTQYKTVDTALPTGVWRNPLHKSAASRFSPRSQAAR